MTTYPSLAPVLVVVFVVFFTGQSQSLHSNQDSQRKKGTCALSCPCPHPPSDPDLDQEVQSQHRLLLACIPLKSLTRFSEPHRSISPRSSHSTLLVFAHPPTANLHFLSTSTSLAIPPPPTDNMANDEYDVRAFPDLPLAAEMTPRTLR